MLEIEPSGEVLPGIYRAPEIKAPAPYKKRKVKKNENIVLANVSQARFLATHSRIMWRAKG